MKPRHIAAWIAALIIILVLGMLGMCDDAQRHKDSLSNDGGIQWGSAYRR